MMRVPRDTLLTVSQDAPKACSGQYASHYMVFGWAPWLSSYTRRRSLWHERRTEDIRLCGFVIYTYPYLTSEC